VKYDADKKRIVVEPIQLTQESRSFSFESPWSLVLTIKDNIIMILYKKAEISLTLFKNNKRNFTYVDDIDHVQKQMKKILNATHREFHKEMHEKIAMAVRAEEAKTRKD